MTKLATKDYKERIRLCVADNYSHCCMIADETNIPRAEVTRLLNLLAKEPGSGVIKKTRGIYLWNPAIQKPNVEKQKTILDWLKTPIAWSIRK